MLQSRPEQFVPGEFAPAKINLCLHVTGRRADGYHLLDSLVVFAGVGDRVTATHGTGLSLQITGPEAAGLDPGPENLVLRAASAMGVTDAALVLDKHLPVASGVGGGSADAAATLRALARRMRRPLPDSVAVLALGADVPVCLALRPSRMSGIGETLVPLSPLPPLWCVLVNPRVAVPTAQVFAALANRDNPPLPDLPPGALVSAPAFAGWLGHLTRNDLVPPARKVAPILSEVEAALRSTDRCLLARMSGSGGTHFGLYAAQNHAASAAHALRTAHPDWWVDSGLILP
jgi:4-diphosphocytidyl-2-C-methyl-D-erythritol kinase